MSKTINCNKIKLPYIEYCRVLQKIIRKTKEMYYNELLLHLQINIKSLGTLLTLILLKWKMR